MKAGKFILLLGVTLLVACVTTTTGDMSSGASSEEAARLNMDLGISYLRQGDYEEAVVKLEKSIQEEPKNEKAHRALRLAYEQVGDSKGAEKEYRTAVRQSPDDADALNQLASFLCLNGDKSEAQKLFDRALDIPLYQDRAMLYVNAGTCVKSSDLVQAENYLRNALGLQPDYPDALFQMGEVAYARENYLQARAFIERYVAVSSSTADSLWLAYRVEVALNDPVSAKTFADQLLKQFPVSVEAQMLIDEQRNAG
jgi:type IV pilus assembly protein PilF